MKKLMVVLAVLALCAGMAYARNMEKTPYPYTPQQPGRANTTWWTDDLESGEGTWIHRDLTAGKVPHSWRSDLVGTNYAPYDGDLSWWCGNFDYDEPGDLPGGYGHDWDEYLELPELDLAGLGSYGYGVLTFAYRHDSEPTYDFTWVQAESLGTYVNLNKGYDGLSDGWQDYGMFGFLLGTYDDPLHARFYMFSDGAASDEDGNYDSDAGMFMCDNVQVFEYGVGTVYFYDDAEDDLPDVCVPTVPPEAGDWWHLQDRLCKASSGTHSWWCGDPADTTVVPPGLSNDLIGPFISISPTASCTMQAVITMACPDPTGGWREGCHIDYFIYELYGWYGDQSSWGAGPCVLYYEYAPPGESIIPGVVPSATTVGVYYRMKTDLGSPYGPGGNGDAGLTIDDPILFGQEIPTAVEKTSWGSIKAMFK